MKRDRTAAYRAPDGTMTGLRAGTLRLAIADRVIRVGVWIASGQRVSGDKVNIDVTWSGK